MRERLAAVHRDWCAEWLPARATVSPSDVEVGEPDGALVISTDDVVCWSFTGAPRRDPTQSALQAIGERMFAFDMASASAAPAPAAIAPAVVRAAWADWLQRLDALWPGFSLEPQQPKGTPGTHAPADPWSGALVASWPWCGGTSGVSACRMPRFKRCSAAKPLRDPQRPRQCRGRQRSASTRPWPPSPSRCA